MTLKLNDIDNDALAAGQQTVSHAIMALEDHIAALEAHPDVPSEDVQAIKGGLAALRAQVASDEAAISADHADLVALHASLTAATPTTIQVTPAQILTALLTALGATLPATGGGVTPAPQPVPTPTTTPPAVDTSAFPLTLSPPDESNTQTGGAPAPGLNRLDIYLASNPFVAQTNDVMLRVTPPGQKAINVVAPRFNVTSRSGMNKAGSNHLVLYGPWKANDVLPKVEVKGVAPGGINSIFFNGCTCDFEDLVANGVWDSRETVTQNGSAFQITNGNDLVLTGHVAVAPAPPVPPPVVTTKINGVDLKTLLANATADTTLPAGTIIGTGKLNPGLGLFGAGREATIIEGSGLPPAESKAGIIVQKGSKVTDLTIQDDYIDPNQGFNAAGIRNETPHGFTVARVTLKGNQNGILTDFQTDGVIDLSDINLDGNGAVYPDGKLPGNTHQMYIGGLPSLVLNVTRAKTITPCRDAHEIKVRAGTSNQGDNDLISSSNGSCYDFPNGGMHTIIGGSTDKVPNAADQVLISFGMENANNATTGATLHFKDHVFKSGGYIICNPTLHPNAQLILENCTYTGPVAPAVSGFATVTGSIVKAG